MEWFKFYHNKWLTDLAVGMLRPEDRLCFITLLCLASQRDERNGDVLRVDEDQLITLTRLPVNVYDEEKSSYHRAVGCMNRMAEAGLITILPDGKIHLVNFQKRQETMLSGAERAKRYRDKNKVTSESDDSNAREDKIRVDESREDNKQGRKKKVEAVIELPAFIDREVWDSWVQFRKEKKKALTPTSIKLQLKFLAKNEKDYKTIIERSIQNSWTGLFEIKGSDRTNNNVKPKSGKYDKYDKRDA